MNNKFLNISMRDVFISNLEKLAKKDNSIVMLILIHKMVNRIYKN